MTGTIFENIVFGVYLDLLVWPKSHPLTGGGMMDDLYLVATRKKISGSTIGMASINITCL